jgi:hypothetical protein|tara:strand:+ start:690 stop:989 length:300 start_codon:yes stop_codon:yes gene_type:complete
MIPEETEVIIKDACKIVVKSYHRMFEAEPLMANLVFSHPKVGYRATVDQWVFNQSKTLRYRLEKFYTMGWWDGTYDSLMNGIIDFPMQRYHTEAQEDLR